MITSNAGVVIHPIRWWLRLEGLVVLVASTICYWRISGQWGLFVLLFLVPDLSMLGYLADKQVGSWVYNTAHSYLAPGALALISWTIGGTFEATGFALAAIWAAHIGGDRLVGYGLKYPDDFNHTHLSTPGRPLS